MQVDKAHVDYVQKNWRLNPKNFILGEPLNFVMLSKQQEEAVEEVRRLVWCKIKKFDGLPLNAMEEEYARKIGISIMSGRGTGKDVITGALIFWFLTCFPDALVPCTAPTAHQLKDVLWRELSKIMQGVYSKDRQPGLVKDWFVLQSDKLYWKESGGKSWFAVARTANPKSTPEEQAETLSGLHEPYMMVVADEASALAEPIFNPLEGTLTQKCNFIFMIFNPTQAHGYAIDSQKKNRDQWICKRWNAEESEHVTKDSIAAKAKRGKDTNFYRVNVLGIPPKAEPDTLIPWEWVLDAVDREIEPMDTDQVVFGVDVGAGGDCSIILKRHGNRFFQPETNDTSSSEDLTGWIMGRIFREMPRMCMVDPIGVGWGIAGNLRARIKDCEIVDVNVAESASEDNRFHRLRDELWWRVRELFEKRVVSIPNDDELISELSTIKYSEPNGKIKVEGKKELRTRGLPSPNRADAMCLTEYYSADSLRRMSGVKQYDWRRDYSSSWKTI